jgi:hypothetical protein
MSSLRLHDEWAHDLPPYPLPRSSACAQLANRCNSHCVVGRLEWGADGASSLPDHGGGGGATVNSAKHTTFDVILAADCVFNEEINTLLFETLLRYAGHQTAVVLAVELREPKTTASFLTMAAAVRCTSLAAAAGGGGGGGGAAVTDIRARAHTSWSGVGRACQLSGACLSVGSGRACQLGRGVLVS